MKQIMAAAVAVLMLAGCAGNGPGPKQVIGGVLGAAGGGAAGAQFGSGDGQLLATGAGAVLGALIGSEVGKSLDRMDKMYMSRTTQKTLEKAPTGNTNGWRNPDSGNRGSITPTETYQTASGRYCREFQQTIVVGGESQKAYGTACRQPDGSWKVQ